MIADFIAKWEQGFKLVMAVKPVSQEAKLMFSLRKAYYKFFADLRNRTGTQRNRRGPI